MWKSACVLAAVAAAFIFGRSSAAVSEEAPGVGVYETAPTVGKAEPMTRRQKQVQRGVKSGDVILLSLPQYMKIQLSDPELASALMSSMRSNAYPKLSAEQRKLVREMSMETYDKIKAGAVPMLGAQAFAEEPKQVDPLTTMVACLGAVAGAAAIKPPANYFVMSAIASGCLVVFLMKEKVLPV